MFSRSIDCLELLWGLSGSTLGLWLAGLMVCLFGSVKIGTLSATVEV